MQVQFPNHLNFQITTKLLYIYYAYYIYTFFASMRLIRFTRNRCLCLESGSAGTDAKPVPGKRGGALLYIRRFV